MKLTKAEKYNALTKSEHLRKMVGSEFTVEQIIIGDDIAYLVGKESSIFTEAKTGISAIKKFNDVFGDELDNVSLKIKINLDETEKSGKSFYNFLLVE